MGVESIIEAIALRRAARATPECTLTIEGSAIRAVSPEGQTAELSLKRFGELLAPPQMSTSGVVLPDGVKFIESRGPVTVWVHETPPRIHSLRWIAGDSATPFGKGTKYRTVRIALPYLVVLAVFEPHEHGVQQLSARNECFFRVAPLTNADSDELLYPALLNCSKFTPSTGKPLSWICTAQMNRALFANEPDTAKRLRLSFQELMRCLLETGFNFSSEHHEGSSWFTESARVDPRVTTVEAWEKATAEAPMFVLDVPWLRTDLSLRAVIERICRNSRARQQVLSTARDAARLVFNHAGE